MSDRKTIFGDQTYNKADSQAPRLREAFWHREAAMYFAQGYSAKDIARILGKSHAGVLQVKNTDWFNEMVTKAIEEKAGGDLLEKFKAQAELGNKVLLEIMENPKASLALKAKIADRFIDRVAGQPRQPIEVSGEVKSSNPVEEYERLQREIEILKARRGGDVSTFSPGSS